MRAAAGGQRSFDDLGTPLADVTFCVLDIETTGGDRNTDLITEIGMVKVRAGEFLGTLQTLVNPGRAIPPMITMLTGITESMVVRAPPIEAVLPSMIEFLGDAVVVGHNVGFDMAFINSAAHSPRRSRDHQPGHRHAAARPPSDPRRGARLSARHLGLAIPPRPPALAPSTRRCARQRPTCCTSCSSALPGSACWGSTT